MMPYGEAPAEANWELIDVVSQVLSTLSEDDQDALHGIFYERKTYQELAKDLNIKAKSHAWRRTESALKNLKKALMENEQFRTVTGGNYDQV